MIHITAFVPIKIQTCSAHQNDHLNLSFVKDMNLAYEKMTRNGRKMAKIIAESDFLRKSLFFLLFFIKTLFLEKP